MLVKWEELPKFMRTEEVRAYYDILSEKKFSLALKRGFDVIVSLLMLIILLPVFFFLAIAIKIDSPGPVFYRQTRVTQYGKKFKMFKFRTMLPNAEKMGSSVTIKDDPRITRLGITIRRYRLDEICQLIDILRGTMSFVGTRPEIPKYVKKYDPAMLATLLLPAGVTSEASIFYKDEDQLLEGAGDLDQVYIEKVLPEKMKYNLKAIENFNLRHELVVMFRTVQAVCGKRYAEEIKKPEKVKELSDVPTDSTDIMIRRLNERRMIEQVVELHLKTFPGFFLTFLGRDFLIQLYRGFCQHEKSGLIIAEYNHEVIGFLAYSEDLSGFYKYLIRHKLFTFAWYSFKAFCRKPSSLYRLIRAFLKPGESKRNEKYVELSSIGVHPEMKNMNVGSKLISELKNIYSSGSSYAYIKLETDQENNEAAHHFYQKNGFVIVDEYSTPEGRRMNEYRWDIKNENIVYSEYDQSS